MDEEKEIPVSAIMYELRQITNTLEVLGATQQKILDELGGNGGPGIRTRLHTLETGVIHLGDRVIENRAEYKEEHTVLLETQKEQEDKIDANEKQSVAMRNIVIGFGLAFTVIQILTWLIPMLSSTP